LGVLVGATVTAGVTYLGESVIYTLSGKNFGDAINNPHTAILAFGLAAGYTIVQIGHYLVQSHRRNA
jgi:hypothetical protein